MSNFSRRYGHQPEKLIQINSMDNDLRTSLWNALHIYFWSYTSEGGLGGLVAGDSLKQVAASAWVYFFKWSLSDMPWDWPSTQNRISAAFSQAKWHKVYDFMEFMAPHGDRMQLHGTSKFTEFCNGVLETERSAYRFVGRRITPITDKVEIKEIEDALQSPYNAVRDQIHNAVKSLSEKPTPDCRTCIKESIGAVETAARLASNTEKGTLGGLLPILEKKLGLHPALVGGYKKLYGYTSDAKEGIRHAAMEKNNLSSDDAQYWLVSCCAFANYLLRLAERAGILKPTA